MCVFLFNRLRGMRENWGVEVGKGKQSYKKRHEFVKIKEENVENISPRKDRQ